MKSIFPWGEKNTYKSHFPHITWLPPTAQLGSVSSTCHSFSCLKETPPGSREGSSRKKMTTWVSGWQPVHGLCRTDAWSLGGDSQHFGGRRFSFPLKKKTSMNCESQPAWKGETVQNINTLLLVFLKSQLWTKSDHHEFLCVPLLCKRCRPVTQCRLAAFSCRF